MLDADGHVIEPHHVFSRWAGERMPMDLPAATPMEPCGDLGLLADQFEHGFDAPSYLRALDAQGIDAAVLYPSIGLFVPYLPELSSEDAADACRSYNEWIADYCAAAAGRLFGVGILPLIDVDRAEKEISRCGDAGLVAMMARPNHLYGRNLGDPAYDRMYDVLAGSGMVLAVHEGLGLKGQTTIGADRFSGFGPRHALSHPMEQMAAMTSLVLDGALERHPDLRVAFLESGTGWLPYWLHRLDEHVEWLTGTECAGLSLTASEYFARQCVISSEAEDALAASVINAVGADHVMWASDFPHPDAVFPDSARAFVANLDDHGATRAEVDSVLWSTPLDFYRLHDRIPGGQP
ncbi:MAG: amidohydrolase family protein [Acidimicrobiales bacterium]